jgi:ribosomal protein L7/L12
MSVNNQALDILHDIISGRREAWDVLFAVAKHNPAALVEAVSPDTAFVGSVLEAIRHGNRIEAIKAVRVKFGCGLKEGKDLCDEAARKLPDEVAAGRVILGGPIPF